MAHSHSCAAPSVASQPRVVEAPEPTDILWENVEVGRWQVSPDYSREFFFKKDFYYPRGSAAGISRLFSSQGLVLPPDYYLIYLPISPDYSRVRASNSCADGPTGAAVVLLALLLTRGFYWAAAAQEHLGEFSNVSDHPAHVHRGRDDHGLAARSRGPESLLLIAGPLACSRACLCHCECLRVCIFFFY